jgi:hypothetical protein
MARSKYFEIEKSNGGYVLMNLVTGMPYYQGSNGMDCDNEVKIFPTFSEALETGRMLAQRYYTIQRGY